MSGNFLPPQLVYQAKTTKFYHFFSFLHSGVLLIQQTIGQMRRPLSSILLKSYLADSTRNLKLPRNHPALLLFNKSKEQYTEKLLKLLDTNHVFLMPPNCTDRLQSLDLSVNKTAKEFSCKYFQKWYALQVCFQLERKTSKERVDLRLSVVKPLRIFSHYILTNS